MSRYVDSAVDEAVKAVNLIEILLKDQSGKPEMTRMSRRLLQANKRLSKDMDGFTGPEPLWLGLLEDARSKLKTALGRLLAAKDDPTQFRDSPWDPKRIHRTAVALGRMETFVLSLHNQLARGTRTQQERMYNTKNHQEIANSQNRALENIVEWLYLRNDTV